MKEKFRQFMIGRYGADDLGKFTVVLAIIFIILNVFFHHGVFSFFAMLTLFVCYFRMFSKNITKRSAENGKYLFYRRKYWAFFDKKRSQLLDKKTHHIYKCPKCKQKIRIPRGKGMIEIRCPKCSMIFKKKS